MAEDPFWSIPYLVRARLIKAGDKCATESGSPLMTVKRVNADKVYYE
jgi:hypothetical protein